MKYYMAAGRLVGTQADAKQRDPKFFEHHVPDDKDGRMAYVNNLLEQIERLKAAPQDLAREDVHPQHATPSAIPPEREAEPPPKPAGIDEAEAKRRLTLMLQGMQSDHIVDKILEARPEMLGRYLHAAIGRFGELGRGAFAAFQSQRGWSHDAEGEVGKKRRNITGSDERGLRYLALCQLEDLSPHGANASVKDPADG